MNMNEQLEKVRRQLATDYNCREEDFLKDGTIFSEARDNPGRRKLFPRQSPYLEAVTMGKAVIVSADNTVYESVKSLFESRSREEIFSSPLTFGHTISCIFDGKTKIEMPQGFKYSILQEEEIIPLYETTTEFSNAIQYNSDREVKDIIAITAEHNGKIIALAGASEDCEDLWQIGIDVLPEYRNKGLASALVNKLSYKILERGKVPYYSYASSNISSQCTAIRSGYRPAWVSTYHNTFDKSYPCAEHIEIRFADRQNE